MEFGRLIMKSREKRVNNDFFIPEGLWMNLRKSCANKSSDTFLAYVSIENVTNSVRETMTRPYNGLAMIMVPTTSLI